MSSFCRSRVVSWLDCFSTFVNFPPSLFCREAPCWAQRFVGSKFIFLPAGFVARERVMWLYSLPVAQEGRKGREGRKSKSRGSACMALIRCWSASWVGRNLQPGDWNSCGGWSRSDLGKNKAAFQSWPVFSLWHPHSCGVFQKSGPNSRSQSNAAQTALVNNRDRRWICFVFFFLQSVL